MNEDEFRGFEKWYNENMDKMSAGDIISREDYEMGQTLYPDFILETYIEMIARTGLMQLLRACFIAGVAWRAFKENNQKDINPDLLSGINGL